MNTDQIKKFLVVSLIFCFQILSVYFKGVVSKSVKGGAN